MLPNNVLNLGWRNLPPGNFKDILKAMVDKGKAEKS
jgi:hypothetical protein